MDISAIMANYPASLGGGPEGTKAAPADGFAAILALFEGLRNAAVPALPEATFGAGESDQPDVSMADAALDPEVHAPWPSLPGDDPAGAEVIDLDMTATGHAGTTLVGGHDSLNPPFMDSRKARDTDAAKDAQVAAPGPRIARDASPADPTVASQDVAAAVDETATASLKGPQPGVLPGTLEHPNDSRSRGSHVPVEPARASDPTWREPRSSARVVVTDPGAPPPVGEPATSAAWHPEVSRATVLTHAPSGAAPAQNTAPVHVPTDTEKAPARGVDTMVPVLKPVLSSGDAPFADASLDETATVAPKATVVDGELSSPALKAGINAALRAGATPNLEGHAARPNEAAWLDLRTAKLRAALSGARTAADSDADAASEAKLAPPSDVDPRSAGTDKEPTFMQRHALDSGAKPLTDGTVHRSRATVNAEMNAPADTSVRVDGSPAVQAPVAPASRTVPPATAVHVLDQPAPVALGDYVVRHVRTLSSDGTQTWTVRLVPESLGELRIEVTSQDHRIAVRLVSADGDVRERLEGQLHHLRDALAREGMEVTRVVVGSQSSSGIALTANDGGGHGARGQHAPQPGAAGHGAHHERSLNGGGESPSRGGHQPPRQPRNGLDLWA